MTFAGWTWTAVLLFAADWLVRIGLSIRVIMRRRPVGVSLAWLALLLGVPIIGAVVYALFGERPLGRQRGARLARLHEPYGRWLSGLGGRYALAPGADFPELARLIRNAAGIHPLPGNDLELLTDFHTIFARLIEDIDGARRTCHLEFYIWAVGGEADDVVEALLRAAGRGVTCRVLVDALGSSKFLGSPQAERLRAGGVHLTAALPVGILRFPFVRSDLRLHRKIAVIDGEVAYTGSQNLVDPRFFKQDAGVGEWVDAMVRVRGLAVEALGVTFLEDWEMETGEGLERLAGSHDLHDLPACGSSFVQVVASGPNLAIDGMRSTVLTAIHEARRELILTTPYFVPDQALLMALACAALRGVDVVLILPAKNDSKLVDLASRAFQGDLARAGVRIRLFEAGLLHTKSITVDGEFSLFGSLNLDPRSLELNFEITLAVYDADFTGRLRQLQQAYVEQSRPFDRAAWEGRSWPRRFAENAARLAGPLL